MKQKLFQYAVLYHKVVDNGSKESVKTEVIVEPSNLLAADEKVALLQIAKKIPDEYQDVLQDVEILVRPF